MDGRNWTGKDCPWQVYTVYNTPYMASCCCWKLNTLKCTNVGKQLCGPQMSCLLGTVRRPGLLDPSSQAVLWESGPGWSVLFDQDLRLFFVDRNVYGGMRTSLFLGAVGYMYQWSTNNNLTNTITPNLWVHLIILCMIFVHASHHSVTTPTYHMGGSTTTKPSSGQPRER